MQVAALLWQIRELTGTPNPLALGGVGLARFLPLMVFSLIGGTVADTLNRRWIIFISQSIMAVVAAILAYLTFAGTITIWNIYLLTAIQAAAIAFDIPARQALIPNIVAREDLPSAFSMTSIAHNTAAIIGPALGGIVIATLGQGYTYLFNSISFMAVLIALLLIGPVVQDASKASGVSLTAALDGLRFIISKPIIFSTMILDFFATFFASANTMMPIVARDILNVGEVGYGWLVSAESIGSVAAGLVMSQIHILRKQGPLLLISVVAFGTATIFFGLSNTFLMAILHAHVARCSGYCEYNHSQHNSPTANARPYSRADDQHQSDIFPGRTSARSIGSRGRCSILRRSICYRKRWGPYHRLGVGDFPQMASTSHLRWWRASSRSCSSGLNKHDIHPLIG